MPRSKKQRHLGLTVASHRTRTRVSRAEVHCVLRAVRLRRFHLPERQNVASGHHPVGCRENKHRSDIRLIRNVGRGMAALRCSPQTANASPAFSFAQTLVRLCSGDKHAELCSLERVLPTTRIRNAGALTSGEQGAKAADAQFDPAKIGPCAHVWLFWLGPQVPRLLSVVCVLVLLNLLGRLSVVCFGGTGLLSELGSAKVAPGARVLQALGLSILLGHFYHQWEIAITIKRAQAGCVPIKSQVKFALSAP